MKNIQDQIWIQIKMHFLSKENIITGEKYNENWNPSLKFECLNALNLKFDSWIDFKEENTFFNKLVRKINTVRFNFLFMVICF